MLDVANLNNPAGRLHYLLTEYRSQAERDKSIYDTWADVFDVATHELLPLLGQAAWLLHEIEEAIARTGHPEFHQLYETFSAAWAKTILSTSHHPGSIPSPGPGHVDMEALAALGVLSVSLSTLAPDGLVPGDDEASKLRGLVEELLEELGSDGTLPTPLTQVINQRLHDVLWAMDHIRIGGPGAVEAAMERLIGQMVIFSFAEDETRSNGLFKKVMDVAGRVWFAYRTGPQVHTALKGWQDILQSLPPN